MKKFLFLAFLTMTLSSYGQEWIGHTYEDEIGYDLYDNGEAWVSGNSVEFNGSYVYIPSYIKDSIEHYTEVEGEQILTYEIKTYRVTTIERAPDALHLKASSSVKRVLDGAFEDNKYISINLPGVTSIGDLGGNNILTTVILPALKEIPDGAFSGAPNLTKVECPRAKSIGHGAFRGCKSLTSVYFPQVEVIWCNAFVDCTSLTSVNFPNVQYVSEEVFDGCKNLTTINFPNVQYIDASAFSGCSGLTSLNLPNVTAIGESAFDNCCNLTSLNLPNVTTIGESAFNHCCNLTSLNLPNVTTIGEHAFHYCRSLTSLNLSNVTTIGYQAFHLNKIPYITFPRSLRKLVSMDFGGYVEFQSASPPDIEESAHHYALSTLIVPKEGLNAYKNHSYWREYFITEPLHKEAYYDFTCAYNEALANTSVQLKGSKMVSGVTADGASQILIYTHDPLTFSEDFTVSFSVNGSNVTDNDITGKISTLQLLPNGYYGFIYTAPKNFPKKISGNCYTVTVNVTHDINSSEDVSSRAYTTAIDVYRPGVLLVHGLGGNADTFDYIYNDLIVRGGYASCQVRKVDYSRSNTVSFDDNTNCNAVLYNNAMHLRNSLLDAGIVSTKYDLVGHSMGGLLSRMYSMDFSNTVNKLITLNTPHFGSEGANLISGLAVWLDLGFGFDLGAVLDLRTNSDAIRRIQSRIPQVPSHAIATTLQVPEAEVESSTSLAIHPWMGMLHLIYLLDVRNIASIGNETIKTLLDYLYNDDHDGIVALYSQLGNSGAYTVYEDTYKGVGGINSNAHHTKSHHWSKVSSRVQQLLKEPKSSNLFGHFGNSSRQMTRSSYSTTEKSPSIEIAETTENDYIRISATRIDSMGLTALVTFEESENVTLHLAYCVLNKDEMIMGLEQDSLVFEIPELHNAPVMFYAIGKLDDGRVVIDSMEVDFTHSIDAHYMSFDDVGAIQMVVGQSIYPNVVAYWGTDSYGYVDAEYMSSDEDIVNVNNGMITALSEGKCQLYASWCGISDTVDVLVSDIPLTMDLAPSDMDHVREFVNVYNMQGTMIKSGVAYRCWKDGLPRGIYIVGKKKKVVL